MTRIIWLGGLAILFCGCACAPHHVYEVTMEERQGLMVRSVIVEEHPGLLAASTRPEDQVQAWAGVYKDQLPNDMNNSGRQIRLACNVGEVTIYIERFRGQDDQAAVLERRFKDIDLAADMLVGWAGEQATTNKDFAALRAFFDGDFRVDMKNMAVYVWLGDATRRQLHEGSQGVPGGPADAIVRMSQYLIERGYVTDATVPIGLKLLRLSWGDLCEEAVGEFMATIVRKMGVRDKALAGQFVAALTWRGGPIRDSLADYVRKQPAFKSAAKSVSTRPDADDIDPADWMASLITPALPMPRIGELFFPPDRLNLMLKSDQPPVATNGRWEAGQIAWHAGISKGGLPPVCYAVLAKPNEGFQRVRLGRVVLDGEELFEYCLWRASLPEPRGQQWEDFLVRLAPGEDLIGTLRAFRFEDQPPEGVQPVITGRDLLVKGLSSDP